MNTTSHGTCKWPRSITLQFGNSDNTPSTLQAQASWCLSLTHWLKLSLSERKWFILGELQERVNIYFEGEFGNKNEKLRILVLFLGCFIFPFKDNRSITVNRGTYEITYYLGILPFKVIKPLCYGAIYNKEKNTPSDISIIYCFA